MKKLIQRIQSLPEPLQRQILLRLALATVLFVFGLISAVIWRDASMLVIVAVAVFFAALGIRIAYRDCIVIHGICVDVDASIIQRRKKAIVLQTKMKGKEANLRIPLRQQFRKIAAGDALEVYIDAAAQIHEWDGEFRLQGYIAIDKTK